MRGHLSTLTVKNLLVVIDRNLNVLGLVGGAHGRLNLLTTLHVALPLVGASRVKDHLDDSLLILIRLVLLLLKSLLRRLNLDRRSHSAAGAKHHEAAISLLPLIVDGGYSLA